MMTFGLRIELGDCEIWSHFVWGEAEVTRWFQDSPRVHPCRLGRDFSVAYGPGSTGRNHCPVSTPPAVLRIAGLPQTGRTIHVAMKTLCFSVKIIR